MRKKIHVMIFAATALFWACGVREAVQESESGGGVGEQVFALVDCNDYLECQDGIWCNGVEYCGCFGGVCGRCLPGYRVDCDDTNPCTTDNCVNTVFGTVGSLGVPGTTGEGYCEHWEICEYCRSDEDCDEGNVCTTDTCVEERCHHVSISCDDGDICTLDGCDATGGCTHEPIAWCCLADADCDDLNLCTLDACNTLTHACVFTANVGAPCAYPDPCFDPGACRDDGLCGPGTRNAPVNDTCGGAETVALDASGMGSASGSTLCAVDDYGSSCGGGGNADVMYRITYQVTGDFQLYAYDVVADADYNSVIYAQSTCGVASTEMECNDNCTWGSSVDCTYYGLGFLDSAMALPPAPVGRIRSFFVGVDGIGGALGLFTLDVRRVPLENNPCFTALDTLRRVDATYGGEFRGNINGYINDMRDLTLNWIKTPCHDAASLAAADWPAYAWFTLSPPLSTTYCIWTDEAASASWFDTVIGVWDNTHPLLAGCDGVKTYMGCSYLAGQNAATNPTQYEILVPGGSTTMVGVSAFGPPSAGDYSVHFDIGACGATCSSQGGTEYNGHCYIRMSVPRDWESSRAACNLWGGHLVIIDDAAENTFLHTTFAAPGGDDPWIGIHDMNTEGSFEWVTGDALVFTNWAAGQPDDAGGAEDWGQMLSLDGTWADCGPACDLRSGICEKP